jgi:hypothetical protein
MNRIYKMPVPHCSGPRLPPECRLLRRMFTVPDGQPEVASSMSGVIAGVDAVSSPGAYAVCAGSLLPSGWLCVKLR